MGHFVKLFFIFFILLSNCMQPPPRSPYPEEDASDWLPGQPVPHFDQGKVKRINAGEEEEGYTISVPRFLLSGEGQVIGVAVESASSRRLLLPGDCVFVGTGRFNLLRVVISYRRNLGMGGGPTAVERYVVCDNTRRDTENCPLNHANIMKTGIFEDGGWEFRYVPSPSNPSCPLNL